MKNKTRMKGQTVGTLIALALLAVGVGASTIVLVNAVQEAPNPPPTANIVDDDDGGGSADPYPIIITSFENNLEDFDVSSDAADNPKNSLQNSLISDSTDRGTALNLSEDGAGPSPATFLVGDSENFTNTIREGDIVKYDVKPKTEENTGLTGLFNNNDANFALGQPSNTIVTYIDLDESDTSSSEFKIWGLNSGNEVEYSSRDSNVDLNPDKYYTVRVDYNSEETPEQVYKAELYNSTSLKSSVNITVPDSFIDENHDDFAIIKFNQESSPKYSYFDNVRIVGGR